MPQNNIQIAKDAGFSEDDILGAYINRGLVSQDRVNAATEAGFSSSDILQRLDQQEPTQPEQAQPEEKGLIRTVAETLPEVGGGMIGEGLAAAKTGAQLNPMGLAMGGTGAMLGEIGLQGYQAAIRPQDAPQDFGESLSRQGAAFARGTGGMALGRGVQKIAQKFVNPFKMGVTAEAKRAEELLGKDTLFAHQKSGSHIARELFETAKASISGGGKVLKAEAKQAKVVNDAINSAVAKFGKELDPDTIGDVFIGTSAAKMKLARKPAQVLYDDISAQVAESDFRVVSGNTKAFASKEIDKLEGLGSFGQAELGTDVLQYIKNMPDMLSYTEAQKLRSVLRAKKDALKLSGHHPPAMGVLSQLEGALTKDTNAALKAFDTLRGTSLLAKKTAADKVWRTTGDQFRNKILKTINRTAVEDPQKVLPTIFQGKNPIKRIRRAREAVGEKVWPVYQRAYAEDLLGRATDEKTGEIIGHKLNSLMLGKKGGLGRKAMIGTFGKEQVKLLEDFSNAIKLTQDVGTTTGTGAIALRMYQFAAVTGGVSFFYTGDPKVAAATAAVTISPIVLAKMMTTPKGVKLLTKGIRISNRAAQSGSGTSRGLTKIYMDSLRDEAGVAEKKMQKENRGAMGIKVGTKAVESLSKINMGEHLR